MPKKSLKMGMFPRIALTLLGLFLASLMVLYAIPDSGVVYLAGRDVTKPAIAVITVLVSFFTMGVFYMGWNGRIIKED